MVLERSGPRQRRGGTLGINRSVLMEAIRQQARASDHVFPVTAGRRRALAWQELYSWLRAEALSKDEITLEEETAVTNIVENPEGVAVLGSDGRRFHAHVIIGADGYRSLVRRRINPEQPAAVYAGYVLWRGLVPSEDLPTAALPRDHEEAALVNEAGCRLVAYPVAGPNGLLTRGQRWLSFTWYDAGRDDLLRETGCIDSSGSVLRSLGAERIPEIVSEELRGLAHRIWPEPWRTVIVHAIEQRRVFATPAAEYLPPHLCRGRLAIVGDAAHVVSPVTGKGFQSGIGDAVALAECLAQCADGSGRSVSAALAAYEERRLPEVHSLVTASQQWSRGFVERWTAAPKDRRIAEAQNSKK